jgi:hypothetical protein
VLRAPGGGEEEEALQDDAVLSLAITGFFVSFCLVLFSDHLAPPRAARAARTGFMFGGGDGVEGFTRATLHSTHPLVFTFLGYVHCR